MKKLILSSLVLMAFTIGVLAVDLTFSWKANSTNELVTAYTIEQAKDTYMTNFAPIITVTGTNIGVVKNVNVGAKYRVVAKNVAGTSGPSNTAMYPTNAPSNPTEFKLGLP